MTENNSFQFSSKESDEPMEEVDERPPKEEVKKKKKKKHKVSVDDSKAQTLSLISGGCFVLGLLSLVMTYFMFSGFSYVLGMAASILLFGFSLAFSWSVRSAYKETGYEAGTMNNTLLWVSLVFVIFCIGLVVFQGVMFLGSTETTQSASALVR